jgi:hypothetical protein
LPAFAVRSRGLKKKEILEVFAPGFTGRIGPIGYKKIATIDYKKIAPLIIKILAMDCRRSQYAAGGFSKKSDFGSFLSGFIGRIVPIGYKNISAD